MPAILPDWAPSINVPSRAQVARHAGLHVFQPVLPVVAPSALTIVMEAELGGFNKGWTDISADVNLGVEPIAVQYGIRGGGPVDRVAGVGTMAWAMKNSTSTSGGVNGYYSPGHGSARSGWDIGIRVRLKIAFEAIWHYKFLGTLVSVQPDPGAYGRRAAVCVAHDWMDEALNTFVRDTAVQSNKRADQIITTLLQNSARRQPALTYFEGGQSSFALALDNFRDEKTPLLRALADATYSEVGYLYVKGDKLQGGTLRFEDRHFRPKAASAATFTNSMVDIDGVRDRTDILNHVSAMIHPRKTDAAATTVLYELTTTDTTPKISPGRTLPLTVFFRDATGRFVRVGATDVVTPVASTDYVANAAADGSGANLTSSLALTFASTSNSATLSFTNNHATADVYLTTLQVRGKIVADRYELSVFRHKTTSEDDFGEHDINYDMMYEDRAELALGVCDWFLSLYGNARTVVSRMTIKARTSDALLRQALAREPGDKITVTESQLGLSSVKYFINGVDLAIKPNNLIDCSWVLAPAAQQQAWLLEDAVAGLLETGTYLGFV